MNDRKEYLKQYRISHKDKYREYNAKYRKTHLTTYDKLKQENQKLKEDIKHLVNIINNNCLELTTTEEEFESLKRWNNE